jgi:hypothetical protein
VCAVSEVSKCRATFPVSYCYIMSLTGLLVLACCMFDLKLCVVG